MINTENVKNLLETADACSQDVTLVAAVKTQTKETVDALADFSDRFIMGENRVQELLEKYDPKYTWHFIGQLQTNKVKYIIDKVELIHSLDRLSLAREIDRQASKIGKVQDCLIEINMGSEISKGGIDKSELFDFLRELAVFDHIRIVGLMSVLPIQPKGVTLDTYYDQLYNLFCDTKIVKQANVDIKFLSAGMSNDFEIALRHGANMIRLGRTIFGERTYAMPANEQN